MSAPAMKVRSQFHLHLTRDVVLGPGEVFRNKDLNDADRKLVSQQRHKLEPAKRVKVNTADIDAPPAGGNIDKAKDADADAGDAKDDKKERDVKEEKGDK